MLAYVMVEAAVQGKFAGDGSRLPGETRALNVSISGIAPITQARASRVGTTTIRIVQEVGPSFPQFRKAMTSNETLKTVQIVFVRPPDAGQNTKETIILTAKATNAVATKVSTSLMGRGPVDPSNVPREVYEVTLVAQNFTSTLPPPATTVTDDWTT